MENDSDKPPTRQPPQRPPKPVTLASAPSIRPLKPDTLVLSKRTVPQPPKQIILKEIVYATEVRNIFGLNNAPYTEIDDYLILLAVNPNCEILKQLKDILNEKYKTCNHQTLEFYGDSVLYTIISMALINSFGLNIRPGALTFYKLKLAKNDMLTLFLEKKCRKLYGNMYQKIFNPAHNVCADTLEALVGMLFYHFFINKKVPDFMNIIYNWIITNTPIIQTLSNLVRDRDEFNLVEKPFITKSKTERYLPSKQELSKYLGKTVGDKLYASLEQEPMATQTIITAHTAIDDIYKDLGWGTPEFYIVDDLYVLDGFIDKKAVPIGIGVSKKDASDNAIEWLLRNNYIVIRVTKK